MDETHFAEVLAKYFIHGGFNDEVIHFAFIVSFYSYFGFMICIELNFNKFIHVE